MHFLRHVDIHDFVSILQSIREVESLAKITGCPEWPVPTWLQHSKYSLSQQLCSRQSFPGSLQHVTASYQQDVSGTDGATTRSGTYKATFSPFPSFHVHWIKWVIIFPGNAQESYTYLGRIFFPVLTLQNSFPDKCVRKQTCMYLVYEKVKRTYWNRDYFTPIHSLKIISNISSVPRTETSTKNFKINTMYQLRPQGATKEHMIHSPCYDHKMAEFESSLEWLSKFIPRQKGRRGVMISAIKFVAIKYQERVRKR